ncbi:BREX-2 system adenine-specific DNA-methyltransferase PglX [Streptomyces sp. NBC_00268]|uniref:BREX-2 system adenine-specific DNA-methyltransferase PglX n=1 Tax=Streptomyces sp. NBC_00268 TaxID=2975695 RepID=UPI00224EBD34|nr:BREX-2 system adenine-specific DNA-methyltransferase PglX [Streptomyces sp. NBC_00268]MCX5184237.1 BREX-2 system adenine-specific DNA-methyltransferase PglX [Streptomyces sp. NBC_00268]
MKSSMYGGEVAAVPPTHGADTGTPSLGREALLAGLRKQLRILETDLRERSDNIDQYRDRLRAAYDQERSIGRTAAAYGAWRDEHITQAAVAWVLGTVFVRYCEDNDLIARPFIAGPGERLAEAEERQRAYLAEHNEAQDRDWLVEAFMHLARSHSVTGRIFDLEHNPLWQLSPSPRAATDLVVFWRQRDEDGFLRFDFTDPQLDTRFLGDLYQDISEGARQAYALVQTPEFIEEFVLDLTVDPAIADFGLKGFRSIDPACGSGGFLLGLFGRLLNAWRTVDPGTRDDELIRRALKSVHGCDVNPFAVNITRFRLLMAAVQVGGRRSLRQVPGWDVNVAVGDALLEGRGAPGGLLRTTGDVAEFSASCDLLGVNSYHVVVGEPPFISVRDDMRRAAYRWSYDVATGVFPLSLLFVERMFRLAVSKNEATPGGYVGQYTSSSFTTRGFGEKLIEDFLPHIGLTHIIDTSGAYVPGHGTPTLILVGRNDSTMRDAPVRALFTVRSEPTMPEQPERGIVWQSILDQIDRPGSTSEWVSVEDEPRPRFSHFPWTMVGGGAADLMDRLSGSPRRLADVLSGPVGAGSDPGERDVFELGRPWFDRHPDASRVGLGLVTGEAVRDWRADAATEVLAPYDGNGSPLPLNLSSSWGRHLWTMRQVLRGASGRWDSSRTRPWWTWRRQPTKRHQGPVITYAAVATHNHFAQADDAEAFSRTAPVLRLPADASEDTYVGLLGVLNSSTACFWLKQTSPNKGIAGVTLSSAGKEWARAYSFAAKSLLQLPLPPDVPRTRSRELTRLAKLLDAQQPGSVFTDGRLPSRKALGAARAAYAQTRHEMVALQEELDWDVYAAYELLSADERARLTTSPDFELPALRPGERAFEIVWARKVADGTASPSWLGGDSWFERHEVTPVTRVPIHWPAAYRDVVQARIDAIESHQVIALVERPEYKRRWATEPWEKREERALRTWLLDRCEDERLWFEEKNGDKRPRPRTIGQLARELGDDAGVCSAAALYAADHLGRREGTLVDVLTAILDSEQVPYAAALRYKESGLRKRAQWERVWELQRREDETGEALGIPVPPKYVSADFQHAFYWPIRGRLDIPRERFISYADAVDEEGGLLLGWSGWSETDRVRVLLDLVSAAGRQSNPSVYRITSLLAGVQELLRSMHRWEAQEDSVGKVGQAEVFQRHLEDLLSAYGLSTHDLTSWRPRRSTRKRP